MKWRASFMMNEMSFLLISNIFSDFSFEPDQRMDGRTDRASYRDAMAHLKIILAYFWIVSSDFCFNKRFSTRAWPTNQPTNQLTDQPTDRASYRGAMAHLKMKMKLRSNANAKHESFAPVLRINSMTIFILVPLMIRVGIWTKQLYTSSS